MTDIYQSERGKRVLGIIGPVQVTAADNHTVGRLYYQEPFWLVNWGRAWWPERISPDYAHALNQRAIRESLEADGIIVWPLGPNEYEAVEKTSGTLLAGPCETYDEALIAAKLAAHEKQKGISDEQ